MDTDRLKINALGGALGIAAAVGLSATALLLSGSTRPVVDQPLAPYDAWEVGELVGYAATERRQPTNTIEIAFPQESYRPGTVARLRFWTAVADVTVRVFHAGPERGVTVGNETMKGIPVGAARQVGDVRRGTTVALGVGRWPSGLYFARATAPHGRVGFAPFVVRPRRLGGAPVAVVLPTRTWQAYNYRDDDSDGRSDTWYADQRHTTVLLGRPYLNRGVPPHFRQYDLHFLHWLHRTHRQVEVLAQADLEGTTGGRLVQAYDLVVFPGHHEYVTEREYDVVQRYRDLGGNLAFLSANNFFWRIDKHGNTITRVAQWRQLGRPEAALIGVMYRGNDDGSSRAPWIVRNADAARWLFHATGLRNGMPLGTAGIEIDRTASTSPRGVQVLADVRDLFGPGFTAQMTYYETPRGARVFAAGAFTLAGSARNPQIDQLLCNLWQRLTEPDV